ncbi:hypothetical protein Nepgr_005369 [Nepenthes gracilis]|uniref:Uncharacterized protein n=1 Tax=Nepenthes gracilis TaxID=150966 RepID=A0AAD3S3A5_NEPGR|nr:hypothetical protein Nepgr_005369 [Nepenthes gracilis]
MGPQRSRATSQSNRGSATAKIISNEQPTKDDHFKLSEDRTQPIKNSNGRIKIILVSGQQAPSTRPYTILTTQHPNKPKSGEQHHLISNTHVLKREEKTQAVTQTEQQLSLTLITPEHQDPRQPYTGAIQTASNSTTTYSQGLQQEPKPRHIASVPPIARWPMAQGHQTSSSSQ